MKKFVFGSWVSFSKHVPRKQYTIESGENYPHNYRYKKVIEAVPLNTDEGSSYIGRICGISRVYAGTRHSDYDEGISFNHGDWKQVWEVKVGMMNRAFLVLEEDLEPMIAASHDNIPVKFVYYSEGERKQMSEWSKDWKRDSHGRFRKCT